ncbi:Predicted branched-chain amino acid permease (azaleucine resistance) [Selenomonas ruminantium]|uniref:Predicted branched-chain amino acid permease (Azaleucine resistance) n=1 Tax=Selenomonas ruminantium TaxID=971 RepID=A0A1I3DUT8_SELRU|nr:AzlC family ABC transporter permease [Selenomonas ruminantium]SFH90507.1 Predicted branched-chain amino acid permease (azaleucine resistance) [Selenomonas ruminantium]
MSAIPLPLGKTRRDVFFEGIHDGIPIALGYFVVSFTLGIAARNAGLTPFQGFLASFFNNASAGEYAAFTVIAADAPYLEMAIITLVANARYMLMSCVVSQKFAADTPLWHRILVGFDITDEIFGITIARKGPLNPYYNYGAMAVALPGWSIGTALGVVAGNLLPLQAVSALSVALFGMFLWVIIPTARDNHIVGGLVLASFIASFALAHLPGLMELSAGTRTIILTVVIAGLGAAFFPIKDKEDNDHAA